MERREARHLRSLGVGRAAPDHDLADARLIDESRIQRRRTPLRGIVLLHVVHHVDRQPRWRTGIERREHARLAGGRHQLHVLEPGVARQLRHVLGPLRIIAILGGNRRERDPVLEHLHRGVVLRRDLGDHRVLLREFERQRPVATNGEKCGAGRRGRDKIAAVDLAGLDAIGIHVLRIHTTSGGCVPVAGGQCGAPHSRRPPTECGARRRHAPPGFPIAHAVAGGRRAM